MWYRVMSCIEYIVRYKTSKERGNNVVSTIHSVQILTFIFNVGTLNWICRIEPSGRFHLQNCNRFNPVQLFFIPECILLKTMIHCQRRQQLQKRDWLWLSSFSWFTYILQSFNWRLYSLLQFILHCSKNVRDM